MKAIKKKINLLFFLVFDIIIQAISFRLPYDNSQNVLTLQKLIEENAKLDHEISLLKNKKKEVNLSIPQFIQMSSKLSQKETLPKVQCVRKEGMLKIRDRDQKEKDVSVTFAILTKERLSYFINPKDETSIQGSIELGKIKDNIKMITGFPTCFTIKTIDDVSDCTVCAESEEKAIEWINAITQNSVNCVNSEL